MLKIKTNKNQFSPKDYAFSEDSYITIGDEGTIVHTSSAYPLTTQDIIRFARKDGKRINFVEDKNFKSAGKDADEMLYTVGLFPDIYFQIISCEKIQVKVNPEDEEETIFLKYTVDKSHPYIKNRENITDVRYLTDENIETFDMNGCEGDYVLYNDTFLYRMSVTSGGVYDFGASEMLNYATTVECDGNDLEAITPFMNEDNDLSFLVSGDEEVLDDLLSRSPYYSVYGPDERFFKETDGEYNLQPETRIMWHTGDLRVSIPVSEDFDTMLLQEEAISQYIEEKSSQGVNKIIDYEKQQFVPVHINTKKEVLLAEKIVYDIRLRTRRNLLTNPDDWSVNDEDGWPSYSFDSDHKPSSIREMGFDMDDIYYRKKKVSESFLRILIYDSPYRSRQKLLYTAKINLNAANLYNELIEILSNNEDALAEHRTIENAIRYGGYVKNPLTRLNLEFTCSNKYDYDESTEGFYFHLFPSNLLNGVTGKVYMKLELNNAKYGETIPLVCFHDGQWQNGYIGRGGDVDMGRLREDMYLPINIKYNEEERRYEWSFGIMHTPPIYTYENGVIRIFLIEPRINASWE